MTSPTTTNASPARRAEPTCPSVQAFRARPRCSSSFDLTWSYAGETPGCFEIERREEFRDDRSWRLVARLAPDARGYESIGLFGGGGRSWSHRIRACIADAAGPWSELPAQQLPDSPGGPRGRRIVASSAHAPRNISGSFLPLANGDLYYAYTASAGGADYEPSWLPALTLTRDGRWLDSGTFLPSGPEWTCTSRPSFLRLPDGRAGVTYSIGKSKCVTSEPVTTDQALCRTVFRTSLDDGRTWSPERIISDGVHDYELVNSNGTRNLVLSNGRLLTHVHCHNPAPLKAFDPSRGAMPTEVMGTYLLISDDLGATWRRIPGSSDSFFFVADDPYGRRRNGFHEITIVEHAPGRLLMLGRTATGWLYECRSSDYGSTWTGPARSSMPHPVAPPNMTMIPGTSTIAMLFNPHVSYGTEWHGGERLILAAQLSDDAGASWHGYREVEYDGVVLDHITDFASTPNWYLYPDYIWRDGILHVAYCRGFRDIFHQALPREWFLAGAAGARGPA